MYAVSGNCLNIALSLKNMSDTLIPITTNSTTKFSSAYHHGNNIYS